MTPQIEVQASDQQPAAVPVSSALVAVDAELAVELAEVREQRKPWLAMGLLVFAAAAERAAVHLAGHEQQIAMGWAAIGFVTAVVVAYRSRTRAMAKHLRRRFLTAVFGAAGWLSYVGACGLSWGAVATLTAIGSVLSLLFWREHRIHGRPQRRVELAMTPAAADNQYVRRWADNIGGEGKKLAGSTLTEMQKIGSGFRFTLELVPGVHTVEDVMAIAGKLRSGLQLLPGQELIIEVHPELPAPTALLTIVTKSTIKVDLPWPGPAGAWDAERGSVVMGPFADGEGVALFSIYRKDGMFGGFMQGGIGSGKSRGIETIALAAASSVSHPTVVWFACGQDGASSPLLMRKADATATTPEDVLLMLDAALEVGRINGIENRQRGLRGFHPTPDRPGLLIIIDEFHNFLDQDLLGKMAGEIQRRMAKIIKELRKAGVSLILATQDPLLSSFGPAKRADVMRSNLLIGNGIMMRSETNQAKQVFKVDVNARDFPDLPGYGYLARPFKGDRQAPFRFYFVNDDVIEQWADSFTWRSLGVTQERMVQRFAGGWYTDRHTQSDAYRADEAALLQQLATGDFAIADDRDMPDSTPVLTDAEALLGGEIPSFDEIMQGWKTSPAPAHEPTAEQRRPLTEAQELVLAAVKQAGLIQPKDLVVATGYSAATVHAALKELERRHLVRKPRLGRYQATAA